MHMVSLTSLASILLEMLLVEYGNGDGVAFATGARKSSKITLRQAMVFDYQAEELSGQAAKVVSGAGSHGDVNLSGGAVMCYCEGRVQDRSVEFDFQSCRWCAQGRD